MNRILTAIVLLVCAAEFVLSARFSINWFGDGFLWGHVETANVVKYCTVTLGNGTFDRSGCANGEIGTLSPSAGLLTWWAGVCTECTHTSASYYRPNGFSVGRLFPYGILTAVAFIGPMGASVFIIVTTAAISFANHARKEGERMVTVLDSIANVARRLSEIARSPALSSGMEQQKLQALSAEFHRLEKSSRIDAFNLSTSV
tara:strand:- start:718 stop:1323 length:606 start_codon:yes stop_codon:yes gene_type:complete